MTSCLLFWKLLTVTDLSITSRFSRMTATVTQLGTDDLNTVGLLRRPFLRQTVFTNRKCSSIYYSRILPQTTVESVTTTSGFLTQSLTDCNFSICSRDFSDVPIISIPVNIHLQCKQSALSYPIGAYRLSYRCQQLRTNYIIIQYTFLKPAILDFLYNAITGGQFTILQMVTVTTHPVFFSCT